MSAFEILLIVYTAVLALAALAVVARMIVGPTILDRAISSDSLVTLVIMGMALHVAHTGAIWSGPAMMGLAGLAFVGTVTFARFVAREDPMQGRPRHPDEPVTDTGPHDAIHLETDSSSENGFADDEEFIDPDGGGDTGFGSDEGFGSDGGFRDGDGHGGVGDGPENTFVHDADADGMAAAHGADGAEAGSGFGAVGPGGVEDEHGRTEGHDGTDEQRGGAR